MNRKSLIHDIAHFSGQVANASDLVLQAMTLVGVVPHDANLKAMERAAQTMRLLHTLNLGLLDIVERLEAVEDFEISNIGENPSKSLDRSLPMVTVQSPRVNSPSAHSGREIVTGAGSFPVSEGEEGSVAAGERGERDVTAQTDQAAGVVSGASRATPRWSLRYEVILDRYAKHGESNGDLAAHFTISRVEVAQAIQEARRTGDPRAEQGDRTRTSALASDEPVISITTKRKGAA